MDLKKIENDLSMNKYTMTDLFKKKNELDDYISTFGEIDFFDDDRLKLCQNANFLFKIIKDVIRNNSHKIKLSK